MKRRLAFALCFVLLAALGCFVINGVLFDNIHSYSRHMMYDLYHSPENIDTLFLGSSHCYVSIDPYTVSRERGVSAFNAGTSQQNLGASYYLIREAARHHKLERVYLEAFYAMSGWTGPKQTPKVNYLITDYMEWSPNKVEFLLSMGPAAFVDAALPARHSTISPNEIMDTWKAKLTDGNDLNNWRYVTYPGEEMYLGKGYVQYLTKVANPSIFTNDAYVPAWIDSAQPISPYCLEMLEKISDFCKKNDIELVLFTTAVPGAFVDYLGNYQDYVDAVKRWCADHDSQYWDFCLYKGMEDLDTEDFSDAHHLSDTGSEKMTAAFCQVMAAERPQDYFYPTLAEKLAQQPDMTCKK